MKLVIANHVAPIRRNTENNALKAVKEFLNMHVRCVEVVEHGYKDAKSANHRLYMEIRALGLKNIKSSIRNDKVYLINTFIQEDSNVTQ